MSIVLSMIIALLVVAAAMDPTVGMVLERVNVDAAIREISRVFIAFAMLRSHLDLSVWEFTAAIAAAMGSVAAVFGVFAWAWSQTALLMRSTATKESRSRLRAEPRLSTPDNKVTKAKFSNWVHLGGAVVLQYVLDPVNIVSMIVIVFQGIGSGWTKHKMNAGLYALFLLLALVQEGTKFWQQSKSDDTINHEEYDAAPLGTKLSLGPDGKLIGLQRVRAESLRLGALVRVRPGQRVPIDGFVVEATATRAISATQHRVSPFAYAVTGEATVKPGLKPLPMPWTSITSMVCGVNMTEDLAPEGGQAGSGMPLGRSRSADSALASKRSLRFGPAGGLDDAACNWEADLPRARSSPLGAAPQGLGTSGLRRRAVGAAAATSSANSPARVQEAAAPKPARSASAMRLRRHDSSPPAAGEAAGAAATAAPSAGFKAGGVTAAASGGGAGPADGESAEAYKPPTVQYLVNNRPLPEDAGAVSRGMTHAPPPPATPDARCRDLYVLAGIPARFSPTERNAKDPDPSAWDSTVRLVTLMQTLLVVAVSLQGWASGTFIRGDDVTLAAALGFLAGQLVMNNGLVPVRAKMAVGMWLQVCQGLFPGVSVKQEHVLETIRDATDALFDKTGTLTVDGMAFHAPLPMPWAGRAEDAFHLLLTNDSVANPLSDRSDVEARLAGSKALATTTEEGVIFDALTTDRADSGAASLPQDSRPSTSLPAAAAAAAAGAADADAADAAAAKAPGAAPASTAAKRDPHLPGAAAPDPSQSFPLVFTPLIMPGPDAASKDLSAPETRSRFTAPLVVAAAIAPRTSGSPAGFVGPAPGAPAWKDSDPSPGRALLALLHYKGPFEPTYVGRFAVATVFERETSPALSATLSAASEAEDARSADGGGGGGGGGSSAAGGDSSGSAASSPWVREARSAARAVQACLESLSSAGQCGSAEGDAAVTAVAEAHGWRFRETVLLMQGGGDVVAGVCADERAIDEEHTALLANPNRTFGHAVARLASSPCGRSGSLCRDDVLGLHAQCEAAPADRAAPEGGLHGCYRLEFLSKFLNPLNRDVEALPSLLQSQGLRFHCCTGDTLLTMRSILKAMGVALPAAQGAAVRSADAPWELMPPTGSAAFEAAVLATAERCAGPGDPARAALVADSLRRKVEVSFEPELLEDLGRATASLPALPGRVDPIARIRQRVAEGCSVLVLCSQSALELLHEDRLAEPVRWLMRCPAVSFGFYRIRHDKKPCALELFSRSADLPEDAEAAAAAAARGGVPLSPPIFVGDGTNDEPVLLTTPHSVAIAAGSLAARNASNLELRSVAALPDVVTMARLNHGGRALVLRDILFVGGFLVAMLAVAAHRVRFAPMAEGMLVIVEDPWTPVMTLTVSGLVVFPRMLVIAVTDGMRAGYRNHNSLVGIAFAESVIAMAVAVWVGVHLAPDSDLAGDKEAMRGFAVMAVASLALVSYLRQNLIISEEITIRPRLLPPAAYEALAPDVAGPGAADAATAPSVHALPGPASPSMRSGLHRALPMAVWVLTGLVAQVAVFLGLCQLLTRNHLSLAAVVWRVCSACLVPAAAMGAYRLLLTLQRALK
ncbi:hypothetical protein FNF31_02917 [Cafeteria roenbergensis]|uniref:Cation-transporting P-type ATPase C-terminal domain-containing protein n=1 Tax=Cafeteria roenbergensis TaxID=33653 RepID=A0A5A8DEP5_CAFRO|nr:hypothetical protein FNF31_02917 [Cafeteria roenbergensis]